MENTTPRSKKAPEEEMSSHQGENNHDGDELGTNNTLIPRTMVSIPSCSDRKRRYGIHSGPSHSKSIVSAVGKCLDYHTETPTRNQVKCSRKRQRVQFESDSDQRLITRVCEVESSANFPIHVKAQLWVQSKELEALVSSIQTEFLQSTTSNSNVDEYDGSNVRWNPERPIYGEALCATYFACCEDTTESEGRVPVSLSPGYVELLGKGRGNNRGLESFAFPTLSTIRSQKRRENVKNVVSLCRILRRGNTDSASAAVDHSTVLGSVAQDLSRPSRKFAHAMGLADALAIFVE